MEKSHKIILGTVLGALTIANAWSIFHGSSNLQAIQNNITKSQLHVDSALSDISFSKAKIESINTGMITFGAYITNVQSSVDQLNNSKNNADTKSITILNELKKNASVAKEALEKTDSMPPVIQIKSL